MGLVTENSIAKGAEQEEGNEMGRDPERSRGEEQGNQEEGYRVVVEEPVLTGENMEGDIDPLIEDTEAQGKQGKRGLRGANQWWIDVLTLETVGEKRGNQGWQDIGK